jgi:acetyltransferase-like isoleucine patch superfamily enzyme
MGFKLIVQKLKRNLCKLIFDGTPKNNITFLSIGDNVSIQSDCHFVNPLKITLSNDVYLNYGVSIVAENEVIIGESTHINHYTCIFGNVKIGKYVMIAPMVMLAGGNHNFSERNSPMLLQGSNSKGIIIEDDVWIGANCVILDGIRIGYGSIIGAGTTVSKNIPANSVVHSKNDLIIRDRFR